MNTNARMFIKVQDIMDWNELRTLGDLNKYCLFDADEVFDEENSLTITLGIELGEWGCEFDPLVELVRLLAAKLPERILIVADCCAANNKEMGIAVWYAGAEVHVERTKNLTCSSSSELAMLSAKFDGIEIQSVAEIYEVVAWLKGLDIILDVDEMNYLADFDIYLTNNVDCRDENDSTFFEEDEYDDGYSEDWDEDDDCEEEDAEDENEDDEYEEEEEYNDEENDGEDD